MRLRVMLFLPLLLPGSGLADTTLKYENEAMPERQMLIQAKDGDVLMGDENSKILVKKDRPEIIIVDHRTRSYMVMDEATVARMEQQMSSAQQQMNAMMQEQMKNMTEEQKAQLRQLMGSHMAPGAPKKPPKTSVKQLGQDTVAGVTCTKLMVLVNEKPSGDVCVATAGVLSVDTKDYEAMVSATDTMRKLVERMAGEIDNDAVSMNLRAMKGIPIRMRDLVDGEVSLLTARSSADLEASLFRVPNGYQRREMLQ